ncbi:cytochrome P450 [Pelagibacterium sp. H642]|uniref:cytochrome P450 n=1 Tax=Pelagibacterium sp. H642 TaxID=1881069 RepID=UPI0028159165|nr:cytochrome P450 [Pelagibacterium sp. H642]WMT92899.1 cytochrome P450 [Pelagibacterium sp. H642]
MFYNGDRFTRRRGAMPPTVLRLLQDQGSVQQLDGQAHRHRKAMFISLLMDDEAEERFIDIFRGQWLSALGEWSQRNSIVLLDEANLVLTRAICLWTGVPLERKSDVELAGELSTMIEDAGSVSPAVLVALMRRRRTERFVAGLVEAARQGDANDTPLSIVAGYRDADGRSLSKEEATVEILNILRPTLAIGRYIMFAALALHNHPHWRVALPGGDDALYERFAEEVRRLYPFFPVIGGIARHAFGWRGHQFGEGDWVMLDLYGTTHDPRSFPNPDVFDPDRNLSWRRQGFDFIPQGGGDARSTHRCPGEQFTVAVIREATRLLVEEMEYDVPSQNLMMPLNRMPARPSSGMILSNVRRKPI